jgi:exonuclease SbcD
VVSPCGDIVAGMKLVHTSDWHVGRAIRGRSRADEHRAVLAEIVDVTAEEDADLVVVAGDLFDNPAPSPEAEGIVYRALLDLVGTGAQVVVLAGNHDNPRRWHAIQPLLDRSDVHVADRVRPPDAGGVVDVTTRSGEVARIALVPFLSQRGIVRADQLMARRGDEHAQRYAERARRIVAALTDPFGPDTVNVVAAHLTVASGAPVMGGGERAAHTIFDYVVPPTVFPPSAQYVALGHLHQPHRVAGACPIHYCGSPLHLDFGEVERDHKQVLVVEAERGLPAQVRPVDLTAGIPLRTAHGSLADLTARRDELTGAHLRLVVTEPARAGLADEVREAFPGAVDVRVAPDVDDVDEVEPRWELDDFQRAPAALFADYLASEHVDDPDLTRLFAELLEDVVAPEAS